MHVIPQFSTQVATPTEILSPREEQILDLVCRGLSNVDIGEELYISINTTKSHIRTAYRKIGVETRVHAVLWGLQNGYGTPDSPALGVSVAAS